MAFNLERRLCSGLLPLGLAACFLFSHGCGRDDADDPNPATDAEDYALTNSAPAVIQPDYSHNSNTSHNDNPPAPKTVVLDANNCVSLPAGACVNFRSNAGGGKDLWMSAGSVANYNVTLSPNTTYTVKGRYSNDGASDALTFALDGVNFGAFTTGSTGTGGNGWNNFVNSSDMTVTTGALKNYNLSVAVDAADYFGVELDKISFTPQ